MPFSLHSHSGQFCHHAHGRLEDMVRAAIDKGMMTYGLSEHMPRDLEDLYPEEERVITSPQAFDLLIDGFYAEAQRVRKQYRSKIDILIGFESEWIRASSQKLIQALLAKHDWDYFIGSVHHVHGVPIDFDVAKYRAARARCPGKTDAALFEAYFDAQHDMLRAVRPPIVGHFDLVRLFSDDPDEPLSTHEGVWTRILRNLRFVQSYGGLMELNSSAVRKGLAEPYPSVAVCKEFVAMGGRFTLSDDAHRVEHVGQNYYHLGKAIQAASIKDIYCLRIAPGTVRSVEVVRHPWVQLAENLFWKSARPGP